MCAEPQQLGRLRKALPKSVAECVVEEIDKDYTAIADPRDLLSRLPDPLQRAAAL